MGRQCLCGRGVGGLGPDNRRLLPSSPPVSGDLLAVVSTSSPYTTTPALGSQLTDAHSFPHRMSWIALFPPAPSLTARALSRRSMETALRQVLWGGSVAGSLLLCTAPESTRNSLPLSYPCFPLSCPRSSGCAAAFGAICHGPVV